MEKSSFDYRIAFIVATKDRPLELRNLLESLKAQSRKPDQIIVIDSSKKSRHQIPEEFPELTIFYKHFFPPSATKQRNVGILEVSKNIELIGFLDDDIEFEPDALEKMLALWDISAADVGGISFNMGNHPDLDFGRLKLSAPSKYLGLYTKDKGAVLKSGFHTMIGFAANDISVQWLPSGAVVWRKEVLEKYKFDEWFDGYSYLEDLDFSYKVGNEYKLMVCAAARYYHYPPETGRGTPFAFGKREVINRIYFVKKHKELSLMRCYTTIFARIFLSLSFAVIKRDFRFVERAFGSFMGLFVSISLRSAS